MMGPLADQRLLEPVAGPPIGCWNQPTVIPTQVGDHVIVVGKYVPNSNLKPQNLLYQNSPRVNSYIEGDYPGIISVSRLNDFLVEVSPGVWATSVSRNLSAGEVWAGWFNVGSYIWRGSIRSVLYDHFLSDAQALEVARRLTLFL